MPLDFLNISRFFIVIIFSLVTISKSVVSTKHVKRQIKAKTSNNSPLDLNSANKYNVQLKGSSQGIIQPSVRGGFEALPIMCLTCSTNSQDKACQNPTDYT